MSTSTNISELNTKDKNFIKEWCRKVCEERANCIQCRKEWLKQKHKEPIKLFEAERVILENIEKKYKWIARDKFNMLGIYEVKPIKEGGVWIGNHKVDIKIFGHLFQFVSWEDDEPYNIDDLLQ